TTRRGHLVYAWGRGIQAETLAKALELADCDRAIVLARAPAPGGFAYLRLGAAPGALDFRLAAPGMSLARAQFEAPSAYSFFYLPRRDPAPKAPPSVVWAIDPGKQPAPAWLPAIHTAVVTTLGAQVHLTSFAPDRFAWRLRAGAHELSHRGGGAFLPR